MNYFTKLNFLLLNNKNNKAKRDFLLNFLFNEIFYQRIKINEKKLQNLLSFYSISLKYNENFNLDQQLPNQIHEENSLFNLFSNEIFSVEQLDTALKHAILLQIGLESINPSSQSNTFSSSSTSNFALLEKYLAKSLLKVKEKESGIDLIDSNNKSSNVCTNREELLLSLKKRNIALDKHEQALLNNLVFPTPPSSSSSSSSSSFSFNNIGGLTKIKELIKENIIYPLKYPLLYSHGLSKENVKGLLFFGPPGTGKTLLAKAMANDGQANFLSIDSSMIFNKWLGESEKLTRACFTLARKIAPCLLFIDEADAILGSREGTSGGKDEENNSSGGLTSVKTIMMMEWDGLYTTDDR